MKKFLTFFVMWVSLDVALTALDSCVRAENGTTKIAAWAVQTYEDQQHGVVCYVAYKEGISCVKVTP